LTGDETIIVTDPALYFGASGMFHAVWATFLEDGAGGPGYYANFEPSKESWVDPIELDVPGIRTPSIIESDGNIFASYYHHNVNGNWWRKSSDGGKTWSSPEQISSQHKGTNGRVSFAIDSNNVLHAFFGERIDDNNHGMWHVTFTGTKWGNIEAVVRGPQRRERPGGNGFDPRSARAVIINGNISLVTWGTDGFAGTNGAWYSYERLNAPELPSVILERPTAVPRNTSTPAAFSIILTESTSSPSEEMNPVLEDSSQFKVNPQASIFIGIVPVLLLLTGIIVLYYLLLRQK
jgi:hypothetical protein